MMGGSRAPTSRSHPRRAPIRSRLDRHRDGVPQSAASRRCSRSLPPRHHPRPRRPAAAPSSSPASEIEARRWPDFGRCRRSPDRSRPTPLAATPKPSPRPRHLPLSVEPARCRPHQPARSPAARYPRPAPAGRILPRRRARRQGADRAAAITHLRAYLERAPSAPGADLVRRQLEELSAATAPEALQAPAGLLASTAAEPEIAFTGEAWVPGGRKALAAVAPAVKAVPSPAGFFLEYARTVAAPNLAPQ